MEESLWHLMRRSDKEEKSRNVENIGEDMQDEEQYTENVEDGTELVAQTSEPWNGGRS